MEPTLILLFALASLASLFMAWVLGAGSSGATPFAPAVGANAIPTMRAAFVAGILAFAGAMAQGSNVSETIGSGLVEGVGLPASGVIVALVVGAGFLAVGIYTGYPIATAFTVPGAVVGVGLAIGGAPAWAKYEQIGAVWVLTPFVGGGIAYAIASLLPREDVPEGVSVPLLGALVGAVLANVNFSFLAPGSASGSLVDAGMRTLHVPDVAVIAGTTLAAGLAVGWVVRRAILDEERRGLFRFLIALGGLVAFSAGGSQVGLAVGPLLPLLHEYAVASTGTVLFGGGLGMLVGAWTSAPRMIKSLSQDYSSLGPRRSIATLVPSFLIAQVAVLLGVPVSFNQIIVSAIVGSGLAVGGGDGISARKLLITAGAWVASFVLAFGVGYGSSVIISA